MVYLHAIHGQGIWRVKKLKPTCAKDDLRREIAKLVPIHRPALVAELKRLGATAIRNLDESHYSAFYNFMKQLNN